MHSLVWGLNIGALGALSVYVAARTPDDRATSVALLRWAPFTLIVLGSLMILLDLTRHVLLDHGVGTTILPMYNDDGSLTFVGHFGVCCTWLGATLLIIGTMWFLYCPGKVASLYRGMVAKAPPAAPPEGAETETSGQR